MKIGFDGRCLLDDKLSGVGKYATYTLKEMINENPLDEFVVFASSFGGKNLENLSWLKKKPNVKLKIWRIPNKLLNLCFFLFNWPKMDFFTGTVDIFFMPNINFCALSKKNKNVLTIHDLSFEYFERFFSFKMRLWHFLVNPRRICRQCDELIAVSESTKEDLVNFYQINPEKISVAKKKKINSLIRFGLKKISEDNEEDLEAAKFVRDTYGLPERFILFLGNLEPRKNIVSVVLAFEELKMSNQRFVDLNLVLVGGNRWLNEELATLIKESAFRENIFLVGYIKDDDRKMIYRSAKVFVYPSFFEGYGYPPIEALILDVPVIASNNTSLAENLQTKAVLIDAFRPDEIRLALETLLEPSAG